MISQGRPLSEKLILVVLTINTDLRVMLNHFLAMYVIREAKFDDES